MRPAAMCHHRGMNADPRKRYVVEAHPGGFLPGIDPLKLNQLLDELEVQDFRAAAYLQLTESRWPSLPGSGRT